MGKNLESLGMEFDGRMKSVFRASYPAFTTDLGKITANGGLLLDGMKGNIIPRGSYMVNVNFLNNTNETTVTTTEEKEHTHKVKVPAQNKGLSAGDRVLVTWVGNEPIVVAVVTSS